VQLNGKITQRVFYLLSLKDKVFKTELNKEILLERNDYIIRNSIIDGWESFGGDVIYNAKDN